MPRYPVDKRIKVAGHIPFGDADPNAKYRRHAGDDSANPTGTPVYAPASGVVTSYTSGQYTGKVIEIFDGKVYPHIFHNSQLLVSPGQRVTEGQLVAYSGNTGLSTGPHIHFGVSKVSVPNTRSFDDYIDPMEYIKQGDTMPSKVDRELSARLLSAYFTPEQIQAQGGETFIKSWVGTESNAMVNALFESPQFRDKRLNAEHNAKLVKDGLGGDYKSYDGPQLYVKK